MRSPLPPPLPPAVRLLWCWCAELMLVLCAAIVAALFNGCAVLQDAGVVPTEVKTVKVGLRYAFESECVDPAVLAWTLKHRDYLAPVTRGGGPDLPAIRAGITDQLQALPAPACEVRLRTQVLWSGVQILSFVVVKNSVEEQP